MTSDTPPLSTRAPDLQRLRPLLRVIGDGAMVAAFGAIGWPWLVRSLDDGGAAARASLLAKLDLTDDALPALGSWRADAHLLNLIADHVLNAKPETVVEFGGGISTLVIARALQINARADMPGTLLSFDGDPRFAAATRALLARHGLEADIRAVPLDGGGMDGRWPARFYRHGSLPARIDFMLVDGPPWFLHPLVRGNAEAAFDRIAPGGTVMLDDAARPGERLIARRWRRCWPDFTFRYVDGPAGTLIGTRR